MKKIYQLNHRFSEMKTKRLAVSLHVLLAFLCFSAAAQMPNLPTRASLSQTLLSDRSFSGTATDTVTKNFSGTGPYTLEVVAKVNSATGRGLDIEARNGALNGFRLSLDAANLKNTNSLASASALSVSRSGEEHTIRIAVQNDSAYIYQNGAYLQGQPVSSIKNIANGVETDGVLSQSGTNIVSGWAGSSGNYTGAPSAYGWSATNASIFAAANATTAGTARYLDVSAGTTSNLHTYNGTTYTGRTFYIRWDGTNTSVVYSYPVTLEANTTYDFSMLSAYISNGPAGLARNLTVGVGTTSAVADRFASKVFGNTGTADLKRAGFSFTSGAAGTYFLTFTGNEGLYSIAELSLNKYLPGSLIPNWGGMAPNLTGTYSTPAAYGWSYHNGPAGLFNTANGTSNVRLMDITPSSTGNVHTYNGSSYTGRLMYIRWDNNSTQNAVYRYPVVLEAYTTYNFSMLHAYINNSTGGRSITVGVGKDTTVSGRIAAQSFVTSGTRDLKRGDFAFTSQEAGLYYITVTGDWAIYSIGELALNKIVVQPRFIFGKNYPTGAADMQIISATYEDGAYAPVTPLAATRQAVTLTGSVAQLTTSFNTDFVVPGKTDVHFTAENTPYANSSINLQTNDSWLFFDNVKPSKVISDWLPTVTIAGATAVNNSNVRIAVYKNGTAVIPNGNLTNAAALTVFTQPSLAGSSQAYPIQTIFNNLGAFNNSIRSFKLKRGYMATLANNANGSGYSRVFIANDSDLVVNAMPVGLDTTVSFIRVMKWNWPSKKGKAGWDPNKLNATWYYDWNIAGDASSPNYDYDGIRQNNGWPSYTDIINKGVNHISGFNEPDQTNQSNLSVDEAFNAFSGMYSTGLRVGSPSPASPESSWITQFLAKCDSVNYRVDYVTIHCYWGGQTPAQWYSRLKTIYDRVKRPLWITEWNNGANWTTESWPSDVPSQQAKQLADMKGILQVLDTASFIERYAEYDWVENKRALVLADTLTPAGKYYAANKSDFAYNPAKAFVHNWKLVAPRISSTINSNDYYKVTVSWPEPNGETGSKYILERKIDGRDTGFVTAQEFTNYTMGTSMSFGDSVYTKATYRIKAFAKDETNFVYSGTLDVVRDAAPVAPTSLTGTIVSASRIQLNWNAGTNVRSYNLKRSLSASGPWDTIAARTTAVAYLDSNLAPNTTYYYVVTTLNSAGESANSTVLQKMTPPLVAPTTVVSPRAASGDAMSAVTWGFQYDVQYKVIRSQTENGVYDTIVTGVNGLRYVDSNRTNMASYYYKVVAYNSEGASPATPAMMAKPMLGQYAYLNFEDTTTTWSEDMWGGYHGSFAATAVKDTGRNSKVLKLDGTATAYANLAPGLLTGLGNFTIATWVKLDALSNWMRIFDFGSGTNQYMFLTPQVSTSNGQSTVRYAIKNGGAEQLVSAALPMTLGAWTHFAVTQLDNTVKLYVNGVLVATSTAFTIKPSNLGNTTQNYLGKSQFADPMLKGSIDEFKIYTYALNDADINSLYNGSPVILPITLASFSGKATPQGNLLNWKITTKSASITMELEKSADSRSFKKIYSVSANSNTAQFPFSYTDAQATGSINYYRLKMIDVDGKVSYSPVVAISGSVKGIEVISFNPTITNSAGYLSIASDKNTAIKLIVTDMYGRSMQVLHRNVVAGSNLLNIDASALATGSYTLSVYTDTERIGNVRFVVSH